MPGDASAAILIGGRSRRMGEPKALLRLAPDGPTMLELVVDALHEVASDVMLVGQADWPIPESLAGLPRVQDEGNGAADGVVAALGAAQFELCLVVGCDMPFLNATLLREMVVLAESEGRGVIASDADGLHPLHAIWRRADLAQIEAMVASGNRSLATIARAVGMVPFEVDAPERGRAASWSVFNANTPTDLDVARGRVNPQGRS